MALPNEQAIPLCDGGDTSFAMPSTEFAEAIADGTDTEASAGQAVQHIMRKRFPEALDAALESPDTVAGLDKAVHTVADELSRHSAPDPEFEGTIGADEEIAGAIETLVRVALEMDDPVAALEEGAESLAEALAARDAAEQEWQRAAEEQWVDQQAAYQHARLHRVSELADVGYSLDEAVAITNANEADIRARAAATGSDPMEVVYRYAVLNGYQGHRAVPDTMFRGEEILAGNGDRSGDPIEELADLVQLNDEAFAEATKGDRWRMLMRP